MRGYRIEPGEVESILQRHSVIQEVLVTAREDSPDNKQLVAYVVFNSDLSASSVELREILRRHLPEYMVPSEFVPLNAFPLLPNGKVDLSALPTSGKDRVAMQSQHEPLANVTEVQLEQIWCELLHREHIGRHEDIFNLGGHSLTLTQLAARIHDNFGVRVPLTLLFEHRTLAQMANIILEQLLLASEDADWR